MGGYVGAQMEESNMRVSAVWMAIAMLGLAACAEQDEQPPMPAPDEPIEGAVEPPAPTQELADQSDLPFAERRDPTPERGSWMQQLEPTSEENCRFTQRPASERPEGLRVQAWSGNMDLLADGEVLGHDHAIGFVEAFFMNDTPVIAVRDGMDDLWIEPLFDDVILRIGADEFVCVRPNL